MPQTAEEFFEFYRTLGLPDPSFVRNSGNGMYGDWLFPQPLEIFDPDARAKVQALSRNWQRFIIGEAKRQKGWQLDNTSDLARVTRLPGTKNHKTTPAKDVTLLDLGSGNRISTEELRDALDRVTKLRKSATPRAASNKKTKLTVAGLGSKAKFDSIAAGCAWAEHLLSIADKMPEQDWYALANILVRCEGGRELFHDISKADPRYSPEETDAKLNHAFEAAGPRNC